MVFKRQKYTKILFFGLLLIAIIVLAGCAKGKAIAGKAIEGATEETTSACLDPSACGYATTDEISRIWTNISGIWLNMGNIRLFVQYSAVELEYLRLNVTADKVNLSKVWNNLSYLDFNMRYLYNQVSDLRANVSVLNAKASQIITPVLVLASPTESEAIDLCASAGYNGCVAGIFLKKTEYFSSKDQKCAGKQLIEKETAMRPCDSVPAAPTGCVTKPGAEPEVGDQRTTESLQSVLCLK